MICKMESISLLMTSFYWDPSKKFTTYLKLWSSVSIIYKKIRIIIFFLSFLFCYALVQTQLALQSLVLYWNTFSKNESFLEYIIVFLSCSKSHIEKALLLSAYSMKMQSTIFGHIFTFFDIGMITLARCPHTRKYL